MKRVDTDASTWLAFPTCITCTLDERCLETGKGQDVQCIARRSVNVDISIPLALAKKRQDSLLIAQLCACAS